MNTLSNTFYNENSFFSRTIVLPFPKENYSTIVASPTLFRRFLQEMMLLYPEIFPKQIHDGFKMKDFYHSKKLDLSFRRISVGEQAYTIHPSFVMPYMTGFTEDVAKPLFLRKFSVPYWAIAHLFGKDPMFWYRLETTLGRYSLVGTTVKTAQNLPQNLVADEKFTSLKGERTYIATTVASNCILGAELVDSVDDEGLEKGYGVFKRETLEVDSNYSPKTVNIDGWKATKNAFKKLFKKICILPCFLHLYLKMRQSKKKYGEHFRETAEKYWHCFKATTKAEFAQRTRRLLEWALEREGMPEGILKQVIKLWRQNEEFQKSYKFKGSHRTSNMVDRLMQRMESHLSMTKEFHGGLESGSRNIRGWALIQNFSPSHSETIKKYGGEFQSPAERLNQKKFHSHWLHNLLISTSLTSIRACPQNPL